MRKETWKNMKGKSTGDMKETSAGRNEKKKT